MINRLKQLINEEIDKRIVKEEKGLLLKIIGKSENDDLTPEDSKNIGCKIASMNNEDKKKHLLFVSSLGSTQGDQTDEAKQHIKKVKNLILGAYKGAKQPVTEESQSRDHWFNTLGIEGRAITVGIKPLGPIGSLKQKSEEMWNKMSKEDKEKAYSNTLNNAEFIKYAKEIDNL